MNNEASVIPVREHQLDGWLNLFTSIVDKTNLNILLLDEAFRIVVSSKSLSQIFYQIYGLRLQPKQSMSEIFNSTNSSMANIWNACYQRTMNEDSFKVEEILTIDDHKYCWEMYFDKFSLVKNTMVSVLCRDVGVTHIKLEKVGRDGPTIFTILDTIDNGICLVENNGNVIDFNSRFRGIFHEAFGINLQRDKNFLSIVPKSIRKIWIRRFVKGFEGESREYEDHLRLLGKVLIFQIKVTPVTNNFSVSHLIISTLDITPVKEAQNQCEKQNSELLKINEELDRFVYSASHDLRAPLTSVKGLANMIKLDPDPQNILKYTFLIEKSVERLDRFISEIIQYSRNAHQEIESHEIDFRWLLTDSLESLSFLPNFSRIQMNIEIKAFSLFFSDVSRLKIIFGNIISNAIQYQDIWKERPSLHVSILCDEEHAKIKFQDNGIGIENHHIDNVFKMFYRGHLDSKGSGLGLYIVKGVVEKLRGSIEISSQVGEGTIVRVEIPNWKSAKSSS